ncbi:hypothetical protein DAEQUDRAFT_764460 [Daedalea quercina L-15889]|uniref:DUF6533 domain-containing protein n=1 Tax=Daedalea quercina L-15889 TaxID=1314783 RepID=A0A165RCG0_9APHY|nr:hypothetical protein DAEQUDRAFT_764460 [Daedalea quercina L-15889]
MSSISADELAQLAKESFTENCCGAAAATLLLYDWVITLGQEYRYVWRNNFRGYTALFLLNRINMLGLIIGLFMGFTPWYTAEAPMSFTEAAVLVLASFQIMCFFLWAIISALRVYAISNRDIGFTVLTFVLALAPVVANLYNYVESTYFVSTYSILVECEYEQTFSASVLFKGFSSVLIVTRVSVIAADAMVLLVTWRHLRGTLKSQRIGTNRISLGLLLLRDGTLYFVLLLLLNIAQIIAVLDFGQNFDPIPDFILPLTSVIIARFILNLRRFSQSTGDPLESHSWTTGPEEGRGHHRSLPRSYLSSIMFRSGEGRGDASEVERTVGSLQDGIMVKVTTFSDSDDFRGESDSEAMELDRVLSYPGPRHSHLSRPYSTQSFDPLVRVEKGIAS